MNPTDEPAIAIHDISKAYRIWHTPASRLVGPAWASIARLAPKNSGPRTYAERRAQSVYRDFWALRNISFELRPGESFGIIGRNGSGKSTLLQIIAGTLQATSGSVNVRGRVAALLELGSGFNPEFTGRENVFLYASVLGLTRREIEARFDEILAFADIGDFIDEPVKTYSSGMALRLAFSVVAHVDADVLIIDEALAVGDVFFVQKCMRWIRRFRERGTLLFVTHNTSDITSLCDRAIWLRDGQAALIGEARVVSAEYLAYYHSLSTNADDEVRKQTESEQVLATRSMNLPQRDQRLTWLNNTQFRNDIHPLHFDPEAPSYGAANARIVAVEFLSEDDKTPLSHIVGGEMVILRISALAIETLENPILGFYLKDRLGQYLFGDNTYLSNLERNLSVPPGDKITAELTFRMPLLPSGAYAIAAAIAYGSQDEHQQQHWIHEAVVIESTNAVRHRGLVAIPMHRIETSVLRQTSQSTM